jgi:thiol-disulfide isomerase/thioredoxin
MATELKLGGPLVLVACIVVVSVVVPGLTGALDVPQTAAVDQVKVSAPARDEPLPAGSFLPGFSAPGLYGGTVAWRTYQGVPTVLVVWAAWCPECREGLPSLARVLGEFPSVPVVTILTAAHQLPGPAPERFMQSHGLSFPVALDTADDRLSDALGVQGFPTVFYVKSDGTISQVTVGAVPEETVRSAVGAIAKGIP